MTKEIWKDVVGYEGHYKVSNKGRVASVKQGFRKWIMRQFRNHHGYYEISLTKDGVPKRLKVHRVVAEAFLVHPVGKDIVNHKDGVKTNNCIENLEWCNAQYNTRHALDSGLFIPKRGAEHPNSILSEADVRSIRKAHEGGVSSRDLARKYHTAQSTIWRCVHRRTYRDVI